MVPRNPRYIYGVNAAWMIRQDNDSDYTYIFRAEFRNITSYLPRGQSFTIYNSQGFVQLWRCTESRTGDTIEPLSLSATVYPITWAAIQIGSTNAARPSVSGGLPRQASIGVEIRDASGVYGYGIRTTVSITSSSTTATVTHTSHGYSTGQKVAIAGCTPIAFNGVYSITVTNANTYTYTFAGAGGASASYNSNFAGLVSIITSYPAANGLHLYNVGAPSIENFEADSITGTGVVTTGCTNGKFQLYSYGCYGGGVNITGNANGSNNHYLNIWVTGLSLIGGNALGVSVNGEIASSFTNISVYETPGGGVYIYGCQNCDWDKISAYVTSGRTNGIGIQILAVSNNTFNNLHATNWSGDGINIDSSSTTTIGVAKSILNGGAGVYVRSNTGATVFGHIGQILCYGNTGIQYREELTSTVSSMLVGSAVLYGTSGQSYKITGAYSAITAGQKNFGGAIVNFGNIVGTGSAVTA